MRLYLDDDSAAILLARLLRQAGHDVQRPDDVGLSGEDDAVHLTHSTKQARVLLTGNHRDFLNLHNLVMQVNGHHPGLLVVRRDKATNGANGETPSGYAARRFFDQGALADSRPWAALCNACGVEARASARHSADVGAEERRKMTSRLVHTRVASVTAGLARLAPVER